MKNIPTFIAIVCISIFFVTPHKTCAQWVCHYTPNPEYHIATQGVGCNDRYHYAPHPDMDMVPTKYVRVAYHIIQDESGGNNIPDNNLGRYYIGLIRNHTIHSLRNLDSLQLNPPYVWPPVISPHIIDSRIQLHFDTIYFHRDSLLWDWNKPNYITNQIARDAYSKFVVNNANLNDKQKYRTLHIILGGGDYQHLGGSLMFHDGNLFITQNGVFKTYINSNHWAPSENLVHEFGHFAGLLHNFHGGPHGYQCDDCLDNDPAGLPCPIEATSNNRMDYFPGSGNAFSQCQIGKMHYYLSGNAGTISPTVINNDCDLIGNAFVIETGRSVVWNHHNTLAGDLILEPGAVLTILCTIKMKSQTKIVVKRGARLIIDQGKITSACSETWRGIEVWGNTTLGQIPPSNQGWVRVINGGSIQKAAMGIYTNRTNEESGRWVPGYTGGIVQATEAKFINNVQAVQFFPYDNFNSLSSFTNCEFVTDSNRYDGQTDAYFVTIIGLKGIVFTACRFLNQSGQQYEQSGIRSMNSYIKIQGKCLDLFDPCSNREYGTFEGLKYGVYATASSPTRYTHITHTEFINNFRGLYLGGITSAWVTSNRFFINTPFVNTGGYGMYLDGCTGYWVEDNVFNHVGANPTGIGLIVHNSGTDPNEIYRNRFEKLEMGISAQGINRNPTTGIGLQILCNDFVICNADLLIATPNQENNRGIAAHQGAFSTDPKKMAGNLFHIPSQIPDGDFDDINNTGAHIMYYYPLDNSDERVVPVDFTEGTVTIEGISFTQEWSPITGCPPKSESGSGGMPTESLIEQISGSQQKIDSTLQVLAMLVDGGNTLGLQTDVLMSFPPEAMQVYNALMSKSPYLSDTVVSTAIFKEQVLPGAMIRDVMVANPHSAKSETMMEKLDRRWVPLPDYMKAQILQGKSIVSAKEQAESRLAHFKLEKARMVNALAKVYHENTDSLAWLWTNDNSLNSKYNLAFLLLEHQNTTQGFAILNTIPLQFTLTEAQQAAHQQLTGFCSLLASLMQDEKNIFELDSQQLLSIAAMEATKAGMASVYARSILLTLGLLEYEEPILLPDFLKSKALSQRDMAVKSAELPKFLNIFPNPARRYIIAEYKLADIGNGLIEFTDISGKRMKSLQVRHLQDQITIDVSTWKPGLYVATLKTNSKVTESVKFTIVN